MNTAVEMFRIYEKDHSAEVVDIIFNAATRRLTDRIPDGLIAKKSVSNFDENAGFRNYITSRGLSIECISFVRSDFMKPDPIRYDCVEFHLSICY